MNENNLQLTDSCNTDIYSYCFLVESGKLSISIFIRFYQLSVAVVFVKNIACFEKIWYVKNAILKPYFKK